MPAPGPSNAPKVAPHKSHRRRQACLRQDPQAHPKSRHTNPTVGARLACARALTRTQGCATQTPPQAPGLPAPGPSSALKVAPHKSVGARLACARALTRTQSRATQITVGARLACAKALKRTQSPATQIPPQAPGLPAPGPSNAPKLHANCTNPGRNRPSCHLTAFYSLACFQFFLRMMIITARPPTASEL